MEVGEGIYSPSLDMWDHLKPPKNNNKAKQGFQGRHSTHAMYRTSTLKHNPFPHLAQLSEICNLEGCLPRLPRSRGAGGFLHTANSSWKIWDYSPGEWATLRRNVDWMQNQRARETANQVVSFINGSTRHTGTFSRQTTESECSKRTLGLNWYLECSIKSGVRVPNYLECSIKPMVLNCDLKLSITSTGPEFQI